MAARPRTQSALEKEIAELEAKLLATKAELKETKQAAAKLAKEKTPEIEAMLGHAVVTRCAKGEWRRLDFEAFELILDQHEKDACLDVPAEPDNAFASAKAFKATCAKAGRQSMTS